MPCDSHIMESPSAVAQNVQANVIFCAPLLLSEHGWNFSATDQQGCDAGAGICAQDCAKALS